MNWNMREGKVSNGDNVFINHDYYFSTHDDDDFESSILARLKYSSDYFFYETDDVIKFKVVETGEYSFSCIGGILQEEDGLFTAYSCMDGRLANTISKKSMVYHDVMHLDTSFFPSLIYQTFKEHSPYGSLKNYIKERMN
jgi:hypothetical protein